MSILDHINATEEELAEISWSPVEEGLIQEDNWKNSHRVLRSLLEEDAKTLEKVRPWMFKWSHDVPPFTVRWTIAFLEFKFSVAQRIRKTLDMLKPKG